ncbi:MAG TPA: hypothetical protein VGB57_00225 [Allosphingosinicella sp.]|jgi:hypothetical protein
MRKASRRRGRAREAHLPRRQLAFVASVGLAVAAAGVSAFALRGPVVDPETDCLAAAPPPASRVMAIDTTDRLVGPQMETVRAVSRRLIAELPEQGRLALVEIRDGGPSELQPLLDRCVPRLNSNRARRRFEALVEEPLNEELGKLRRRPDAPQSPVMETTFAIAAEPRWRDSAGRVTIVIATDAMQNTDALSFYRRGDRNPIVGRPLKKVSVILVPLRNERDLARQGAAFDRLVEELQGAGAEVTYQRPPWLAFEEVR